MNETHSEQHPVDALAEEFVARYRRGERPSLTEYVSRYPELADEIRDLFPALVMMEDVRPGPGSLPGAAAETPAAGGPKPERVGDYRVLREVGRGGMGVVYEAEQESLGRHVALKVLPASALLDPTQVQRFQREARAAAGLHHTNIVPVFGVGEADGLHFYVMQFIQGNSLDQVLEELKRLRKLRNDKGADPPDRPVATQRGPASQVAEALLTGRFSLAPGAAPPDPAASAPDTSALAVAASAADSSTAVHLAGQDEHTTLSGSGRGYWQGVARIGVQVAEALAHAHGQGVLHRDIKPSNLLLDTRGTVWVTDFGLAKAADGDDLTRTGDIVGTLRYMAPERLQGKSDPRSDLYGLGVTLYELLALRPAFDEADRARLVGRVLHEEPPRPRRLNAEVPRDLETVVLKAMAKEPGQRYASAAALAEDLRRFLADRPVRARRASAVEQGWRWCRRNPLVASLLTLVAVLLAGVALVSTIAALLLNGALAKTQEAERQARLREADALVGQAYGIRNSRRPGQRFDALGALDKAAAIGRELGQPPEWYDRLRNEAIAALALPDIHITREFDGFPPGTVGVDLSDDFELYAQTTKQGACTIRRVADDSEVTALPQRLGEPALAEFGPGRVLVLWGESSGRLQLWDLGGPKPARRLEEKEKPVLEWHFRPDGKRLGMSHEDGSISVYDVATGARLHRLKPVEIVNRAGVRLHPTEPFFAVYAYLHHPVQVRDLRTGAVVAQFMPPWNHNYECAWAPDGRTLAVSDGDSANIQLLGFNPMAPKDLQPLRVLKGPPQGGYYLCYNPAGDRLVARGWSNIVHLFDPANGFLFATHSLPSPGSRFQSLRFDRTGQRLAAARIGEQRVGLWSVGDAREYRALVHTGPDEVNPGEVNSVSDLAIHPRGRLAAVALTQGSALFDLESGQELPHMAIPGVGPCSVAFDGQGNLVSNGFGGCFRWPIRPRDKSGQLSINPPERLPFYKGDCQISASTDGRVIAQSMWAGYGMAEFAGGWILHPNAPNPRRVLDCQSVTWNSVSPDGRWVAFGRATHDVNVYDAATARPEWQSPDDGHDFCRFSPDGRWLATDADGGRLYSVGTWERGPQLGPGTPWDVTSDGKLAVVGQTNGIYRLVEVATGREEARLEDPEQNRGPASFTPDGTKLVVAAKNGLRVWDLRRIRQELGKRGLDWDAPPYPPAEDKQPPVPIEVEIISAEQARQRGLALRAKNDLEGAIREFQAALRIDPNDLGAGDRYNAACAAALAGCGQGQDAAKLDDKERARLRRQALDWLQADLGAWRQQLDKDASQAGPAVLKQMRWWQDDTDFAGVRGPEALAKLPKAERPAWQKLWQEVAALHERAEAAVAGGKRQKK